jgi:hypothetical protein
MIDFFCFDFVGILILLCILIYLWFDFNLKVEIQDSIHIFIVWSVNSPPNNILTQAQSISVVEIQVVPTTASTIISPPNPIDKVYNKIILSDKNGLWGLQYIFSWQKTKEYIDNRDWEKSEKAQ